MRLFGFVVASIGLHLLLLLIHLAPDIAERAPDSGLTITLKPFANEKTVVVAETPNYQQNTPPQPHKTSSPTSHQQTTVTHSPTTSNNQATSERAEAQTSIISSLPVEPASVSTTTSVTVVNNEESEQTERSTILALLHQAFRKHYEYPKLAARKGWHGEVLLGFTLDAHGTIVNAHIAKSSGYRLLDHAALKSLSKVTGIQVQLNESLTFDLPVSYGLTGS